MQTTCLFSTFQLIYIGYFQPYVLPWQNALEIVNEFIILTSTYFLFCYTDGMLLMPHPAMEELVKDEEMLLNVGWGHTGLLAVIVAINMIVMTVVQIVSLIRKIKLWCMKRAHKKMMAEHQKRKQLQEDLHRELKDFIAEDDLRFGVRTNP